MEFTKTFAELSSKDSSIAGGKGASLGEMTQAGIPVPEGFVVLAVSYTQFLGANKLTEAIDLLLKKVDSQSDVSINSTSERIKKIILDAPCPKDIETKIISEFENLNCAKVAVRSSATAEDSSVASWAGELESYLNVDKETLVESVKKCWASLFTPRAIFYRFEKKLKEDQISVAVVVQRMVNSEISGIAFTVNPVNADKNQIVAEAGFGLGEAVVGGLITPDNYVIDKTNFQIIEKKIAQQNMMIVTKEKSTAEEQVPEDKKSLQKLSDEQIVELAKICVKIEEHYGFPCDIEWGIENSKIYILQSRPITTLS